MSKVEGFVSYIWNMLVMWLLLSFEHGVHHSVGHFLPVASTRTNHASGRREDWELQKQSIIMELENLLFQRFYRYVCSLSILCDVMISVLVYWSLFIFLIGNLSLSFSLILIPIQQKMILLICLFKFHTFSEIFINQP